MNPPKSRDRYDGAACPGIHSSTFWRTTPERDAVYLVHDDGYRTRQATYREVGEAAHRFADVLRAAGFVPEDKLLIWSENRAEWVVALWGSLIAGVVVVPVDYRASSDLVRRVSGIVRAKWVLVGDEVERAADVTGEVRKLSEVVRLFGTDGAGTRSGVAADREPRATGRDHLHVGRDGRTQRRHHHSSEHPGERRADRAGDRKVPEVHLAVPPDSVPESPSAQPHVRSVDGGLRAADAFGHSRLLPRLQPGRDHPSDQIAPRLGAGVCAKSARCPSIARRTHRAARGRPGHAGGQALVTSLVAVPRRAPAAWLEVLVRGVRRGTAGS